MSTVAPTITEILFDKSSYVPGEEITATVKYTPGASESVFQFTGTATDTVTGQAGTMEGTFNVESPDSTTITVSDTGNRTWTQKSDAGGVAVFTAVA